MNELDLRPVGEPREADLLFRTISKSLGELVSEGVYIEDSCGVGFFGDPPQHPPTFSRHWKSPEPVSEEDEPFLLKVREHNDPCAQDLFSFSHEADRTANGDRTIDYFGINNNGLRLYVERWKHSDLVETARRRAEIGLPVESGYPVEIGVVYSSERPVADLRRLEALATILPKAVQELLVGFPHTSTAIPEI